MKVPVVDSNMKANRDTTKLSICPENASRNDVSITDTTVTMDREDPGTPVNTEIDVMVIVIKLGTPFLTK